MFKLQQKNNRPVLLHNKGPNGWSLIYLYGYMIILDDLEDQSLIQLSNLYLKQSDR